MKKRRFPVVGRALISGVKAHQLYRLIHVLLLATMGLFIFGSYLGIRTMDWLSGMILTGAVLFVVGFGHAGARGRMLLIIGLVATISVTEILVGFRNCVLFVQTYFHWAVNVLPWQAQWVRGYETVQIIFLAMGCFLLEWLVEKGKRLKMGLALLCLGWLTYLLFADKSFPHVGVTFALIYLLITLIEVMQTRWEKVKSQSSKAYILWILPFLVLYAVLMLLMPAPDKPYDWQFVKNAYHQLQDSFRILSQRIRIGHGGEYEFALSGFSESGKLGNGIVSDDREVMILQSETGLRTNVYLIGKVFDTFDGTQWLSQNEETDKERYMDTIETLYAAERYDGQNFGDYLSRVDLKISYRYFRSGYLFAPLKTCGLKSEGKNLTHDASGGSLMFDDTKGYGTEYKAIYYQMNAGSQTFVDFISAHPEADEEALQRQLSNAKGWTGEAISEEDLKEHRRAIYEYYLEAPGLSSQAQEYLSRITEGAKSDVEKLMAIEKELSSFAYTKSPGELPETVTGSREFLDYFLLESRQGYCNHFATAFVLLAREEGIPARYVQGFCVGANGKKETYVYSNMAHAWPEVYLDDIGWIPFEPTPGFATVRYTPWEVKSVGRQTETDRDEARRMEAQSQIEETVEEESEEIPVIEQAISIREYLRQTIRILLTGMGIFAAGIILVFAGERLIAGYRYQRSDMEGKYQLEIAQNMRILALLGISRSEEETLEELQRRAQSLQRLAASCSFIGSYESVLYAGKAVDDSMLQEVRDAREQLAKELKESRRIAYFYYCIVK